MLKILLIFGVGLLEQCLYTAYLISVNKRQITPSSILMVVYMSLYLFIVAYALKDTNSTALLITYAAACGVGNFITMLIENYKYDIFKINDSQYQWRIWKVRNPAWKFCIQLGYTIINILKK